MNNLQSLSLNYKSIFNISFSHISILCRLPISYSFENDDDADVLHLKMIRGSFNVCQYAKPSTLSHQRIPTENSSYSIVFH